MISPRHRSGKTSKSVGSTTSISRNSLSKQEPSIQRLPLEDDAVHDDPARKPAAKRSNPLSSSTAKSRSSTSCRNLDPCKEPRKVQGTTSAGGTKPRTSSAQRSRSSDDGERVRAPSVQRHRSSTDGSILQRRAMSVQKRRPDAQEALKSEHRTSATKDIPNTTKRSSSAARIRSDASSSKPVRFEHSRSHDNSAEKSKSSSRSTCPDSPGKPTRRKVSSEDARSVHSNQVGEKTPDKPIRRKVSSTDARSVHSNQVGEKTPDKPTRRKVSSADARSVHSNRVGEKTPDKPTRRKVSSADAHSVHSNQGGEKTPDKPTRRKVSSADADSVHSNQGGEKTADKTTRRKVAEDGRSVHSSRGVEESPGKRARRKVTDDGRSVHSSKGIEESPGKQPRRKLSVDDGRSAHSKGNQSSNGHPPRSKRLESEGPAKEHSSAEPRSPAAATKHRTGTSTDAPSSPGKRRTGTRRPDEERKSRSGHKTSSRSPRDHRERDRSRRKPASSSSANVKSTNDSGGKTLRRPSLLDTSEMQKEESDRVELKSRDDATDSEGEGGASSGSSHCSHTSSASTVIQFDPTQKSGVAIVEQKESFMEDDDCLSIASFHDPIGDAHRIMNTNPQRAPILSFLDSDGEEMDEQQSCFSQTELRCPSGGESVQGGLRCPSGGESVQTSDSNTSSTLGKLQFYVPSTSGSMSTPSHPLIFDIEEFQDFVASSEEKNASDHGKAPRGAGTRKKTKETKDDGEALEGKISTENRKIESSKKKYKDSEVVDNGNPKRQLKSRSSRRILKKTASSEQLFEAAVLQMKNESNGLQPPSDDDDSDSEDERLRNNFSRTVGLAVGLTAYESELEVSPSKKQPKTGLGIGKYFFGNSNRKKRDANGDEDASDSDYSCSSTSSRRSVFGGRMGRRHSLLGNGDFENAVVPFSS